MTYLNKIATSACFAALGMLMLTGCEGAELYSIGSPDWISEKVDSIRNANQGGGEEELVGMDFSFVNSNEGQEMEFHNIYKIQTNYFFSLNKN